MGPSFSTSPLSKWRHGSGWRDSSLEAITAESITHVPSGNWMVGTVYAEAFPGAASWCGGMPLRLDSVMHQQEIAGRRTAFRTWEQFLDVSPIRYDKARPCNSKPNGLDVTSVSVSAIACCIKGRVLTFPYLGSQNRRH